MGTQHQREPDAGNNHEAGWKFIGWSPEVEATVSKTVTYVAQWEQKPIQLSIFQEDTEHLKQQQ